MTTDINSAQLFDPSLLTQFTGTQSYYPISSQHLLTDGTRYLSQAGRCFWIMDAIASHLAEIGTMDWFVLVRVICRHDSATMIYEDGNGNEHARQEIPHAEFALEKITLYACWDGAHWVIMLPSEY